MGLCLGCAKFRWPVAMQSLCRGMGSVGRRLSAQHACTLPAVAPALPAAELEHHPSWHGAQHQRAVQLHELCHGGHCRQNVWGKYRSFCIQRHTR